MTSVEGWLAEFLVATSLSPTNDVPELDWLSVRVVLGLFKVVIYWYTIHTFCEVSDNDVVLADVWYWFGMAF